ncbi:SGNH/GDSL hydrolase family protein [Streptomyces sp. ISL-66]|uniref:SGNH/GDSL hydrolase family protein n=1 Tax=Streptomyces sp. ISL-66 TaxID=2819186 RepID=UPI001BE8EAB8|nr:SGNH/GDSL hydrolase family protein [Streptomyces sp. ISL-66]MBT2467840.1 SGNH/GDSL hydrolase family protein [Streptomyces sp. ISL-66]
MAFPVGTPVVTFTGTLPSAVAGVPFKGQLVLTPSARLVDAGRNAVYTGGGKVPLDSSAHFSVQILPCDAAGIEPVGWRWWVDVQPTRGQRYGFWANIAGTGTVDLAALTPVPAPGGGSGGGGGGAVSSVNDKVGAVVLNAADVDADPEGTADAAIAAHAVSTDPHGDRAAAASALAAHEADTTSVHGISNTATLETQSGAQAKADAAQAAAIASSASDATAKVTTHEADTTAVHGIADTALLETSSGAQSKADAAQSTAVSTAAADATAKVAAHSAASDPHGDRADAASKYLAKTNNLSDLGSATTARTNLGLAGAATLSVGTTAGTVAAGDDSRFSAIGSTGPQSQAGLDGGALRTAEIRISDGAVQDLATAASWAIAATSVGTQLKCSIPAEAGDRIRVDLGMLYSGTRYLDAVILDSVGAINLYAGTQTTSPLAEGNPEFYPSTSFGKASSGILFTVASGHLSGGQATIALANQGTGAGRIYAYSGYPCRITLTNLGPAPAPTSSTIAMTSTPASGYIKYAPAGVTLSGSDVTGPFLYLGAGGFQIGSGTPDSTLVLPTTRYPNTRGTLTSSQSVWSVRFGTDATAFQVRTNYQSTGCIRILVNGRPFTDLIQPLGGTTPGNTHLITANLGAARPRTVQLDFSSVPFGGIYLPPGATMWRPASPSRRIMVLGDSIPGGSSINTGGGAGTWFSRAARLLGYEDAWNEALGSTGYITVGTSATLGTRAPIDVIPNAPDVLFISAGYNDNGGSQPSISTAAASLYSAIKTGLPSATIYVLGCWSPTGSPGASITNTDATLRTAAAAANLPFISLITGGVYNAAGTLIATHGPWITGTGRVGAPTGAGNADTYIGTDAVHPTDSGHTYLAGRVVAAVQELQNA